ncbi:MAG: 3-isopropylmalate dehydratase large subunit [Candidatus Eisenbacteria sp.]|nr:3-isopropylmalate dehydratase large subunit [Candidatus Eisenbacteria bacterium]
MGKTFAEKILAVKSGQDEVSVGQIVDVSPDATLSHDNTAAISKIFESIGVEKIWDPAKPVIVLDHCVPAATEKYASNHKTIREFVARQGIGNFHDINAGVCHQVLAEQGHALPGRLILGSDSHTTSYGALGAFAAGIGRSEMAVIFATGTLWLRVPETLKLQLEGPLPDGVEPKDVVLRLVGELGADGALYRAVEYTGSVVEEMSVGGRMTLCNMAAEMGAKIGYVAPDKKTARWLEKRKRADYEVVISDEDAEFEQVLRFDMEGLAPQVAKPHTVDNVCGVDEVAGTKIQQALVGTCTNGRLEDLESAARILSGKKVHRDVRLLVFPASMEVYREALDTGVIGRLVDAGAVIMNPGCGPCLGAHEGALAPGEVCLSTANRNFKGRMGCREAEVYLASPLTVAASAVQGEITDPREFL